MPIAASTRHVELLGIADTTAPVCVFISPTPGQTVSGTISIQVAITDTGGSGLWLAALRVDDPASAPVELVYSAVSPYFFTLDTTTLSDGAHTLYVRAEDLAENIGPDATVSLNVANVITAGFALQATGALAAAGRRQARARVALQASGSLSTAAKRTRTSGFAVSAQSVLTVTARARKRAAVSLQGTSNWVLASGSRHYLGRVVWAAQAALVTGAKRTRHSGLSLSAQGALSAAAKRNRGSGVVWSSQSLLAARGSAHRGASFGLTGEATLAVEAHVRLRIVGSGEHDGTLAGQLEGVEDAGAIEGPGSVLAGVG